MDDTTLTTVTIISLLLAWAMAIVSWQRVRAERRRSDARLATLMSEMGQDGWSGAERGRRSFASAELPTRRQDRAATRMAEPGVRAAADGEVRAYGLVHAPAAPPAGAPHGRAPGPSVERRRFAQGGAGHARRPDPRAARPEPARPSSFAAPSAMVPRRPGRRPIAAPGPHLPFDEPPLRARRDRIPHPLAADEEAAWRAAPRRRSAGGPTAFSPGGEEPAWHGAPRRNVRRGLASRSLSSLWRAVLAPKPPARTRWGHRVAACAGAAVLVAGAALAERTLLQRDGAGPPVELLSLDHRRQGDYLAVSGSLRNPRGGRDRQKLSVSATVYDRAGAIIGTGQTPLPVAGLPPGGETGFTISLPDADLIDRYRVSFMEDRSKLPHVDRRRPPAAAPTAARTGSPAADPQ